MERVSHWSFKVYGMQFHRVVTNPAAKKLWCLDAPEATDGEEVDPRNFCECGPWESSVLEAFLTLYAAPELTSQEFQKIAVLPS
jgi:hypothetical protein